MHEELKHVSIYTDGSCEPNPGPGGYGIVLLRGSARKTLSGGFRQTTNNRMEMYAAIRALESLNEPCRVTLYSDSTYLVNTMTEGWAKRWQANNWMRTKSERAVNADLWERLLELCEIHQVEFVWVKGHAGNHENEVCDRLSYTAASKPGLPADKGYKAQPAIKVKVDAEGQPCRKCGTPVVRKKPRKNIQPGQTYYYEYYLYCPNCETMYLVEAARKPVKANRQKRLFPE
jgi:ribonuclease HI